MMLPPSAASFRCSSDPLTTDWCSDPGKHFSEHFSKQKIPSQEYLILVLSFQMNLHFSQVAFIDCNCLDSL